jgi:hypothetical protein
VSAGIHVFLGPSLGVADARAVLPDAEYLPPVKMGDVQALMPSRPRVVCIVDGYFERVPAVWHKEILFALSQGVRVVGASSMGALRAAELHAFGMEGVGAVFEGFRDGTLTADDEVAISHASADDGYRPLSEALVNVRDGLARAAACGLLLEREHAALLARARATFYPERSWGRVLADAASEGLSPTRVDALRAFFAREKPNRKRDDALLALRYVAGSLDRAAPEPSFEFEPTAFWQRLVRTTAQGTGGSARGVTAAAVVDLARVALEDFRDVWLRALLDVLAMSEAARAGIQVSKEKAAAASELLRFRAGLASADKTREWLAANALTPQDFTDICRVEAVLDELTLRHGTDVEDAVVVALKRSGRFAELAASAARHREALAARGAANPSLEDAGIDERALLAWYAKRFRPIRGGLDAHAKERGFRDTAAFLREAVRVYCAEKPPG